MKALTIWQPWASLLACGAKRFETRSWATSYRGPIAIHAATLSIPQVLKKTFPMSEWTYHPDHDAKEQFLAVLTKAFSDYTPIEDIMGLLNELPTGAIVATANLIECHKITAPYGTVDEAERALGNWTPGRYAWEIANVKMITPVPIKGRQGLWNLEGAVNHADDELHNQ